ncbi:60S ribosomal protein L15 [Durusdinium trenchii]|uniref:Ribosomal protein L15 n=4 Tax=Durusdinium trenchii TaxID=1381693 RepID=A0ABP0Q042_9DINO
MGAYKYLEEMWRKKQSDVMRFLARMRNWEFRQLPAVHRCSRPTRPDKARKVGYKAKQGYCIYRVRVKRGDRKKRVAKGIVYGKPVNQGINKWKAVRNLRSIAEERVGRKCGSLRVLNSYWVAQDAMHKWYEVVMVDPFHNAIRNDPRINWICKPVMKHRELRGVTAAGRKARGLLKKGKRATKLRPSARAVYRRHSLMRLRRYRASAIAERLGAAPKWPLEIIWLNALLHSVNAFGPVQLNFGPPESDSVEGWEAAFGTVTGTPFLQLTSLDPPVFGYWGGDYQSAVHVQLDASPNGSFSILPENVFLCLVSVPVGSYHLEVSVGNASGVASSCLELDNGVRIYEGQTLAGAIDTAFAQLQKQDLDSCLTLRACAEAVVNSWKVEEITCHSSCSFCSGTSDGQCAVSCTEGRTLTASESGTYCLARVPYAPSGLSASEVTNSSLQLSWVLGLSGGEPVIAHRVRLEGEVLVTTDTTFVDVTNLTGDTEYTFQVQALSAAGDGDLSDPLTIRTGPVLPWAPLDLRAVAGQYEVNLTWTAPSYNGGAAIVSYLVSALGHDQTWTSASTEVTADGLEGYSVYTFEVQALNSAGYGAANTTEIRTLQVPPGPVEQLNVSRAEQYLLRLDWSPPSFDGGDTVSGYYIWCQASQPGVAIANQSSSQTFALLKDLQGYTLYQCRVSALNGLGLSMASWIQARTLAVPPHQPGQPIVEEEQLHKVKLSWAEPEGDSGANLSGYKVYGSMDSMNWYVVWNDTQSPNTTWWILDLEAYTVYYFTIAGLNEIGEGLKSEMVSAYTAPVGLPHPPSLPVINTSHSRLQVSWTLLNDGGTNVTGFEVELAESGEAFEAALNVSEPFVTISGLLGNITYRVRIRALSTGGRSYPSHIAEATTDAPVVPDAPADLRMEALAPHTAWLRFTAPLDEGGRPVEEGQGWKRLRRLGMCEEPSFQQEQLLTGLWIVGIGFQNFHDG